jgi:6-phosphogluconolactonase
VQTNEADANRVLAFRRAADGHLSGLGSHRTGGRGDGCPAPDVARLGGPDRRLRPPAGHERRQRRAQPLRSRRSGARARRDGRNRRRRPKSVAERDGLLYVLNADAPSLAGFRLAGERLESLGEPRDLAAGADPAQVGFSPDGSTLVVTERGTNSIVLYPVSADGQLGEPGVTSSSGPTPYGFAFAREALIVTEAFGAETGDGRLARVHDELRGRRSLLLLDRSGRHARARRGCRREDGGGPAWPAGRGPH